MRCATVGGCGAGSEMVCVRRCEKSISRPPLGRGVEDGVLGGGRRGAYVNSTVRGRVVGGGGGVVAVMAAEVRRTGRGVVVVVGVGRRRPAYPHFEVER